MRCAPAGSVFPPATADGQARYRARFREKAARRGGLPLCRADPAAAGSALPLQGPLIVPLPRLPRSPAGAGLRGRRGKRRRDAPDFGGAKESV
jgi:hypothetical protein